MADDERREPTPLPTSTYEDIEDLKAQLKALAASMQALQQGEVATGHAEGATDHDNEGNEEEEAGYPPFILLLEPAAYEAELRMLIEWVEGVLVPGYLSPPEADAHWCHLWFDHPAAVARLHALWLAWQELTDPQSCGYTGPSTWHRDHHDPCMRELRSAHGPFQGCTKGEHQTIHRLPGLVPSAWRGHSSTDSAVAAGAHQ